MGDTPVPRQGDPCTPLLEIRGDTPIPPAGGTVHPSVIAMGDSPIPPAGRALHPRPRGRRTMVLGESVTKVPIGKMGK